MPLEAARKKIIPPGNRIAKEKQLNIFAEFLVLAVNIHLRYNSCMYPLAILEPVDYLIIGHLTRDVMPSGDRLGGSVAYSALVAHALGLRVGVVTSWGAELPLGPLSAIQIASFPSEFSTTFEIQETSSGRNLNIYRVAQKLDYYHIPEPWRRASVVHLAPIAQEVEPSLVRNFSSALVCATLQGWLRTWGGDGHIRLGEWPEAPFVLQRLGAAVISVEDVNGDEGRIEEMAAHSRVLAVTEGAEGVRVYWNGDVRRFRPPSVSVVDTTGAGDVFAASFFARLYMTRDPWESARFATQLAAISVSRPGFSGIPTPEEIQECLQEVY
jgi:pfkB family carbohydrate kinase